ncbi:MAG: 30S ribosomal protein S6--L-glutamate ligase [Sandaracinaceae bacterium]|nr:30S ribosomal protein S6--L-glutamate ligase [Sandaracinaceae bacterium]
MKIGILTMRPESYSVKRLVEAAEQRGHQAKTIGYMETHMSIAAGRATLMYEGAPVEALDAVIPRIAAAYTFYGTAVVRQLEMMGMYTVNGSQAISRSRDKLRSFQILSRKGVGLPVTGFGHATRDTQGLVQTVGGPPIIIKLIEGTQGVGVVLAETMKAAESVIDTLRSLNVNFVVQEYIAEAVGKDLRCFVVGGRVVAAMERSAAPGEFRANLHRGGKAQRARLSPSERAAAVSAAKAMHLPVCGVDLIRSDHGPLVLEVNSSPGLEGIEQATGKDVASKIIEHIEKSVLAGGGKRDHVGV